MYELIAQVGYEKASINKICSYAGVAKSSFYHFFESKEQVLLEIVKASYTSNYEEELRSIESTSSVKEYKNKLLQLAYATLNSYTENEHWRKVCAEIDLQSERMIAIKEIVDRSNKATLAFIQAYLQHGVKLGAFAQNFEVEHHAELLLTIYLGLDVALLYDYPIRAQAIISFVIENMFQ